MNNALQLELRNHLSDALDILWVHYGNGFGTNKQELIAAIQNEIDRIDQETKQP